MLVEEIPCHDFDINAAVASSTLSLVCIYQSKMVARKKRERIFWNPTLLIATLIKRSQLRVGSVDIARFSGMSVRIKKTLVATLCEGGDQRSLSTGYEKSIIMHLLSFISACRTNRHISTTYAFSRPVDRSIYLSRV